MKQSDEVRNAFLRFCDRLSAGDVAAFDDLVSKEAKLVVGTAPGELVDDRPRMRYGFEAEGVRLDGGSCTPTSPSASPTRRSSSFSGAGPADALKRRSLPSGSV